MRQSLGRRFIAVGLLILVMTIPGMMAEEVVDARRSYQEQTVDRISREWGGGQILSGPVLVIPVERDVRVVSSRPKLDPVSGLVLVDDEGAEIFERFEEVQVKAEEPVYLLPEQLDLQLDSTTEQRRRGIFEVPVYVAEITASFAFDLEAVARQVDAEARVLWDRAELRVGVGDNRGLRGQAVIEADGAPLRVEPLALHAGFLAQGDPREVTGYRMALTINGAQALRVSPVGRVTHVKMRGDWADPSFDGAFLPDSRSVTEQGFEAAWTIPHLARSVAQAGRGEPGAAQRGKDHSFGVAYIVQNDFYQKAYRAARYAILFVALTFLTILLIDRASERPAHPVQYLLAGLVQVTFVLLMVAYAEQIGFAAAYALSAGAVVVLLTLFGLVALRLGARALVLGGVLAVIYGVLFLILHSADYALLAGSTLAFVALAVTMFATRNEDWYGPEKPRGPGLFARMTGRDTPPPAPVPARPSEGATPQG